MSMFPSYNFNDPDLDYEAVLETVYQMYSYLENGIKCCGKDKCDENLSTVDQLLVASSPDDNPEDYNNTIKSCYRTLYPLT